ncbi:MAG: hypothetical protein RIS34_181 [Pseudomonadota bacterium]|jgi:hypothetical protein
MDCLPHFHVAAIHDSAGFRSATPGIGVLCARDETSELLGAGVFDNSLGRASLYGMYGWRPLNVGSVKLGVFGGVITGYIKSVNVFGGVSASMPFSWGEAHVLVLPNVPKVSPTTVGLSFTVRF